MSTSGSAMGNMMSGDAFFSGGSMQSNASVMPTKKLSYKERLTKHLTELSVIQRTLNQDPGTKPSIVRFNLLFFDGYSYELQENVSDWNEFVEGSCFSDY